MSVSAAKAAATGETGEQAHAVGALFGGGSCPSDVCLYSSTGRGAFVPSVQMRGPGNMHKRKRSPGAASCGAGRAPTAATDGSRWVGVLCGSPLPFRRVIEATSPRGK